MTPVSLAENLDPPLTLSFLFLHPTRMHHILQILFFFFKYPATGSFMYPLVSWTLVEVLTMLSFGADTVVSSQAALGGKGAAGGNHAWTAGLHRCKH